MCLNHLCPSTSSADRTVFWGPLLDWYRANKRDLPWRRREDDPYAVWVSEIMLQQTQVATVIPYYERWMARFPTIESLAAAPLEDVLKLWAGLGYYARARNLHRAGHIVVEKYAGGIPSDLKELVSLPGIGRYTAGAILSIAFNQPAPIVDANVARVLARVYALPGDPKSSQTQADLWHLAESLLTGRSTLNAQPSTREFNQALMELGALVCTPADPACERCPLLPICRAGNSPDPTQWPETPPSKATVRVTHCSVLLRQDDRFLLVQRPAHGLWGGLWEFPRRVCNSGEFPMDCAARAAREVVSVEARVGERIGTIKHGVTHHAITLYGFEGQIESGAPEPRDCAQIKWVTVDEIIELPLSAPQTLLAESLRAYIAAEQRGARQARLPL